MFLYNKNVNFKSMWLDISSDMPNTLWREGVSHSIAFIFNSRDQMRSSSLHYIGCKVLLYCRVTLGLAPGCVHVYAACSILLRRCARIRIARIFFSFLFRPAGPFLMGRETVRIYTPYSNIPR